MDLITTRKELMYRFKYLEEEKVVIVVRLLYPVYLISLLICVVK